MPASAYDRMAHLLRRAGFGARPDEINGIYLNQGFEATVDQLVNYENVTEDPSIPAVPTKSDGTTDITSMGLDDLASWWLNRMIKTRRPLQEKMVLFWHDHFATSYDKIGNPKYMYWQNKLVRDNATGDLRTLLKGINRDPSMLIWLDSILNTKNSPNENYGRELMELFSIGFENFQQGAYTEADVQQAARAFTGWGLLRNGDNGTTASPNGPVTDPAGVIDIPPKTSPSPLPSPVPRSINNHDFNNKTVFGQVSNFNGDDIVDLILDHEPQRTFAAKFIGKKLFEYFAYEDPEPEVIAHLAAVALRTNFNIKAILRDLFLNTKAFYSDKAIKGAITWPAHFLVGSARLLQASINTRNLNNTLRGMGQWLFFPPDVAGWPGGTDWISTAQTLARANWANSFATNRSTTAGNTGIPMDAVLALGGFGSGAGLNANPTADQVVDYFTGLLVQSPLAPVVRQGLIDYMKKADNGTIGTFSLSTDRGSGNSYKKVRGLIHLLMVRPERQNM